MKHLTYRQLLVSIQYMPQERLDDTAIVFAKDSDEYIGVNNLHSVHEEQDVLDSGHIVMEVSL